MRDGGGINDYPCHERRLEIRGTPSDLVGLACGVEDRAVRRVLTDVGQNPGIGGVVQRVRINLRTRLITPPIVSQFDT